MKRLAIYSLFFIVIGAAAQTSHYNVSTKKLAVEGYDLVSYFEGVPTRGNKKHTSQHDGITYIFASEKHLNMFKASPGKYMPQYGGYCAYAIAMTGKKVSIDPKTFEIRDNKLYLFYNSWGTNTLKSWIKKQPEELKVKADRNWKEIMKS